ncbi:hypothetical protein SBOR_2223 [Sclerotinia borealis F-4128]|uniref:Uncharacterized protein n=1 Tax=Sclerotinia borealis (strain F-4128) TaxID=1432307 RepID=W9CSE2_SCLBF|nr:hypothetical protein SBOR_2223 [Sclerotinia borealis F-4128]
MAHTTTTITTRPSLLSRLRGAKTHQRTYENSTSSPNPKLTSTHSHNHNHNHTHKTHHNNHTAGITQQPPHHHQRKPSIGDKISGAMMKLRGRLTRKPGLKAAGTRRMRGTDGRGTGSHSSYVTAC